MAAPDNLRFLEIATNIADLLAFFLVTIDLYGRERLEALGERLKSASRSRPLPDLLKPFRNMRKNWRVYAILYALYAIVSLIPVIGGLTGEPLQMIGDKGQVVYQFTGPSVIVLPFLLPLMMTGVWTLFFLPFWVLWAASEIVIYLVDFIGSRVRIDGAMLVVGAFIYVLARIVSIAATFIPATSPATQ